MGRLLHAAWAIRGTPSWRLLGRLLAAGYRPFRWLSGEGGRGSSWNWLLAHAGGSKQANQRERRLGEGW